MIGGPVGPASPDISRVELAADARRGTQSHSHPLASVPERSRCGQISSPAGWRSPNFLLAAQVQTVTTQNRSKTIL